MERISTKEEQYIYLSFTCKEIPYLLLIVVMEGTQEYTVVVDIVEVEV